MRFVDTSFLVALFRHRERHHEQATRLWAGSEEALLTSVGVVGELWTLLRRREHYGAAVAAVDAIYASDTVTVVLIDDDLTSAAWKWLKRHDERAYSFVDAASFEIMRRRRVREALAFDDGFTSAGFVEVRVDVRRGRRPL